MGEIKRKRKLFSRPGKPFDKDRIEHENELIQKYGLKNKREIWKVKSFVSKLRRRAKELIREDKSEQEKFFEKLNKKGLGVFGIADVLALNEENILNRRLQTFVFKKKLSTTVKGARQLIVHKNVKVSGSVVNIPSFNVDKDLENSISLKVRPARKNKVEVAE